MIQVLHLIPQVLGLILGIEDHPPIGIADLLHREDVQTELRLDQAQLRLWLKKDPPARPIVTGTFEADKLTVEAPADVRAQSLRREKLVWEVLRPAQTVRLWELFCQWNGPFVILRGDFQQRLELSADQVQRVARAQSVYDKRINDLRRLLVSPKGEIGRLDPQKIRSAIDAAENRLRGELDQTLDNRQRESLRESGGRAFAFAKRRF